MEATLTHAETIADLREPELPLHRTRCACVRSGEPHIGGVLESQVLFQYGAIITSVSAAWWVVTPFLVSRKDQRLKSRNPTHHARIVRFYRLWGFAAALTGAVLAIGLSS